MTYSQAITYLNSFINYEKIVSWPYNESLKLERFRDFLSRIGNPQSYLKCIHVAGTKGKGSTCAFIAYILREAGFKAGLYTSPHLSDFRERIRILRPNPERRAVSHDFEGMISRKDLADLATRLKPAIQEYNRKSKYGALSFFEVYTALGFIYFKEKNVDFAVLETGLGGRLDATNTADSLVAVITPVSYEHTQKLGSTLRRIATEKAGIIKERQRFVVSAPQRSAAMKVIRQKCRKTGAKLYEASGARHGLRMSLLGGHQLINAQTAIRAVKALRNYDVKINSGIIKKGIQNTLWPGRCEVVSKRPFIVLDGAQNSASAEALKKTIKENFSGAGGYNRLILIFGISKDKDIKGVASVLNELADSIILTKADNPRAALPGEIKRYLKGKEIYSTENVKDALKLAKLKAGVKDLILVTGSLFVVGEARRWIL